LDDLVDQLVVLLDQVGVGGGQRVIGVSEGCICEARGAVIVDM
jgi:hypothetical protein